MPLVQNDDGVVQCPASHVGQGGDLDQVIVHVAPDLIVVHQVLEGVEQRTKIRVDLGFEVAGQEPEVLASLDGRPHQHDLLDTALPKRCHRHGHRDVRLARARRTHTEYQLVVHQGMQVAALTVGTRADHPVALADFKRARTTRW